SNLTINGLTPSTVPNLGTSIYDISTNPTFCVACHNSASPSVTRTGWSSTITANTNSGSTTVTTPSTSALTRGMTISGNGIPNTTTTTTTFTASITSGSAVVTMVSPATISLRAGTVISGIGIPTGDTVATSVNNATSFTLTTPATATATETLTATIINPRTVTITAIPSATTLTISTAANAPTTGTTLTVTHMSISQVSAGSHGGSAKGQDLAGGGRLGPGTSAASAPACRLDRSRHAQDQVLIRRQETGFALDEVGQLAHVSGPLVPFELSHHVGSHIDRRALQAVRVCAQVLPDEQRNVSSALPQRREPQVHHS